jgi:hypothetical protein
MPCLARTGAKPAVLHGGGRAGAAGSRGEEPAAAGEREPPAADVGREGGGAAGVGGGWEGTDRLWPAAGKKKRNPKPSSVIPCWNMCP